MKGERGLIEKLGRVFGQPPAAVVCGIGDDTAVIAPGGGDYLLWTIDSLIEGVHFDLTYTPLKSLGRKALAVNLSDIAAMGGQPQYALLALGWPPERPLAGVLELARGMQEIAGEFGVALIGGDTVSSPGVLSLSLTVLGRVEPEALLRRDGARVGDEIYVTGPLGQAAAGLEILRRGLARPGNEKSSLVQAFLHPRPQVAAGGVLAKNQLASASIDLSDGVASDLQQICLLSRVGAVVHAANLPIPGPVAEVAALMGREPWDLALRGGEDYQLLFTAPPGQKQVIQRYFRQAGLPEPVCIGEIIPGSGVRLRLHAGEIDISGTGFDHFPESQA
ncbi:MAG: thiamine-phosphate kinase [Deltaproteobacteria bacterium]|nr:thiamine-phosphate kinase [Deltaproteobacteria bacterium]